MVSAPITGCERTAPRFHQTSRISHKILASSLSGMPDGSACAGAERFSIKLPNCIRGVLERDDNSFAAGFKTLRFDDRKSIRRVQPRDHRAARIVR